MGSRPGGALRTLLQPALWTPTVKGQAPPLLQAVLDSRKGQAELSAVLGERARGRGTAGAGPAKC
ncbi:MAG: hypothetical protein R2712_12350 [Vicinamibacterales bacterium]